jgi:hypothetical protein
MNILDAKQLPVLLLKGDCYSVNVDVEPMGRVTARYYLPYRTSDTTQGTRDAISEYFERLLPPKPDYYWRGTNNRDEIRLLRRGELRPSKNHADNTWERGLSVADHLGYVVLAGYKYGYRVRGQVIASGSDGEVVLDISTLDPLDRAPRTVANIQAKEGKQYHAILRETIERAGWTIDLYLAAMYARVYTDAAEYEAAYQKLLEEVIP